MTLFDLRLAPGYDLELFRPGRHLVEAGPSHGVEPLAADGLVAVVHRPRRGVLALEGIPGVQSPQPPVPGDPRWHRVHEARRVPLPVLPWPDRPPVPAAVIHEGDGELFVGLLPVVLVGVLAQRYVPEATRDPPDRGEEARQGESQLGQVLAPEVAGRVRAGADVRHGMLADLLQLRIVPPAPQVVAGLLVRGVGHPLGPYLAGLRLREVDEDLLPVGLVVVGAEDVAPPVIESVEEPVPQHDPTVLANHITVVREALSLLHEAAVQDAPPLHVPARDPPPGQQRQGEERVCQPRDVADAREAAPAGPESLLRPIGVRVRAARTATPVLAFLGVGDLEVVHGAGGVLRLLGESLQGELSGRHHADGVLIGTRDPEAAGVDVGLGVHRVEPFAFGEPDHGLEAAQQLLGGPRVHAPLIRHARPPIGFPPGPTVWIEPRPARSGS